MREKILTITFIAASVGAVYAATSLYHATRKVNKSIKKINHDSLRRDTRLIKNMIENFPV